MGTPEEIVLAGGAALVLMYNAREATRDVDVCWIASEGSSEVRKAARRVAAALDLPEDWLNDGDLNLATAWEPYWRPAGSSVSRQKQLSEATSTMCFETNPVQLARRVETPSLRRRSRLRSPASGESAGSRVAPRPAMKIAL
jgi:hypothetical protein